MHNRRIPVPPPASFSVASAGGRLDSGKAGIYRKTQFAPLIKSATPGSASFVLPATGPYINNPIAGNTLVPFSFDVHCPSSRIRVAFGVTSRGDAVSGNVFFGLASLWNVIPCVKAEGSGSSVGNTNEDTTEYFYGRPLFYLYKTAVYNGFDDFAGRMPPPYDDIEVAGVVNGDVWQQNSIAGIHPSKILSEGRALPDSWESQSMADLYRAKGYISGTNGGSSLCPIAWAAWEITDPRDGEDTEALLAKCTLSAPRPPVL